MGCSTWIHFSPAYQRQYNSGSDGVATLCTASHQDWDRRCPCDSRLANVQHECSTITKLNYCSSQHPENCGCTADQIKDSNEKTQKAQNKNPKAPPAGHCNTCTSSCCDYKRRVSPDCSADPDGCGQLSTDPPGKTATIQSYGKFPLQSPGIYLKCDHTQPGYENCDKPPYRFLDEKALVDPCLRLLCLLVCCLTCLIPLEGDLRSVAWE